jgi:hypothetical protein
LRSSGRARPIPVARRCVLIAMRLATSRAIGTYWVMSERDCCMTSTSSHRGLASISSVAAGARDRTSGSAEIPRAILSHASGRVPRRRS